MTLRLGVFEAIFYEIFTIEVRVLALFGLLSGERRHEMVFADTNKCIRSKRGKYILSLIIRVKICNTYFLLRVSHFLTLFKFFVPVLK